MNNLGERLSLSDILVAPGIYDAFGAMLAENAGFECLYISGASISYTRLGKPDIGLVSVDELTSVVGAISERVNVPLIVDADTGFGNAINVQRTIGVLERVGASAIQLEDQSLPKRCGHLSGKELVSKEEMCGKIKAAVDARRSDNTLIVARTDAVAVEGFGPALDRAEAYVEAGADVLFIEALQDDEQMSQTVSRFAQDIPLLANMVEGGKTPLRSANELQSVGYSIVIFPGGLVRALAQCAAAYFENLKANGTTQNFQDRMLNFGQLNELLGTEEILNNAEAYDGK
jgi:2-methylisocitrate lyase-like PEP mutase family enzyme